VPNHRLRDLVADGVDGIERRHDAALALQTYILAAEAVGLGCCPISAIRNRVRVVAKILSLPRGVFAVSGLCIGYPSAPSHVSMRLLPSITVHADASTTALQPAA